MLTIPPH